MSNLMMAQFNTTHSALMNEIKDVSEEELKTQPEGFNNTIHWHIGHVLTANEMFLFGFPENTEHLPEHYNDLFGYGSKPEDWPEDVPSADELAGQLTNQLKRIKQIPEEKFDEKLPKAVMGAQTFGELAALAAFHEANHVGRINAMKKVLNK
ncbi:DinB superfamily protein [Lentibacillus persicus]|uniref:DinB superfamily protein n=1 Tax=Lentibacillus persicus TaxID=640948 RepID=A0A1I1UFK5_9BACI|nr:DinB family protein [Lentibacillus persicus]SFD67553.1 DinB superfamily protein [Lentibacillus persicus]